MVLSFRDGTIFCGRNKAAMGRDGGTAFRVGRIAKTDVCIFMQIQQDFVVMCIKFLNFLKCFVQIVLTSGWEAYKIETGLVY